MLVSAEEGADSKVVVEVGLVVRSEEQLGSSARPASVVAVAAAAGFAAETSACLS